MNKFYLALYIAILLNALLVFARENPQNDKRIIAQRRKRGLSRRATTICPYFGC
ncbi:hypothetical protein CU097_009922 [Rhizopus azygosporus]|uniref:Uncharacterized protein n=2 Tax=Rhizopus TaxID=4842 RepID=A0A367JV16_RHIAZ|nr:hypothetical protein BCV71DRAFT_225775 [Rhizopus microsporus]RCH93699.1 hypothetical protein CU097_009922 [Rhizopus azygosporus]